MRSFFAVIALACCALWGCSQKETGPNDKKFVIARDPSWGNLPLMGRNAHLRAFSDDLLAAIAQKKGISIEIQQASTDDLFYGLNKGSFDAILSAQPPRASQKALYFFSAPYFALGPVLIVPASSAATALADFGGKKIGLLANSNSVILLDRYPTVFITQYDNNLIGLEKLSSGEIDGYIMGTISAHYYCANNYAGILKVATSPLTDEALRLITLKSNAGESLVSQFNEGLDAVRDDGTLDLLLVKWGFAP